MSDVEEQVGVLSLGINKSIKGGSRRGRYIHAYAEALQGDAVEPQRAAFVGAWRTGIPRRNRAGGGLHENVAVVCAAAGPTHVRLAEAINVAGRSPAGVLRC